MLNAFNTGMHRHVKAAAYADRRKQSRDRRMQRPGAHGFTFSGQFQEVYDMQPVMANDRRRNYTAYGMNTSGYQAVTRHDVDRGERGVNRYGMRLVPALASLMVLVCLLGICWMTRLSEKQEVANRIAAHERYIEQIESANETNKQDIIDKSKDVNIQQEAVRIGMVCSKGEKAYAVSVPENAVLGPGLLKSVQSLAAILGQ